MYDFRNVPVIDRNTRIFVLTGAGISAESGISTFRDADGLWEQYRVEDVATQEGFERAPETVWNFYQERRKQMAQVRPNPAHIALARLEQAIPEDHVVIITQNIDNLHRLAGTKNIYHMHGELSMLRCLKCGKVVEDTERFDGILYCECGSMFRPDVVWFGEMPYHMNVIEGLLHTCDIFLAVGTSGLVYPAAGFLRTAKLAGSVTLGVNLEEPVNVSYFDCFIRGKAGEVLPRLVDHWLEHLKAE